jgi:ParB family chromosome partitioning protein
MSEKSNKRGLGTGLSALFGEMEKEDVSESALLVPIEKVEPRVGQPRSSFNADALSELADSIREYGVIQPITVRKLDAGYYQIIAGERRWRAAREAGLSEVPVRLIDADDQRATELALVENLQREDLNPIEEATGYRRLMDEFGLTQEDAAARVGKSRPAVANALRLLGLSPSVLEMVSNGDISAGHARALLPVRDGSRQLAAAVKIVELGLSVRQAESLASRLLREESEKPLPEGVLVDYRKEAEKNLSEGLGRGVRILGGKKKGRIELEFYSSEDRENLISALMQLHKQGTDMRNG